MSVMKKQLMKVKQIADQTFLRTDKTEVLNKDIERTEKRLEALKHTCQTLYKKMQTCHQGAGQEPVEKRKKRMPEIQLSHSFQECFEINTEENILLKQILESCATLQGFLGDALLEGQVQSEKEVLAPLHDLLEVDIPNVLKLRKQVFKLSQDMDAARSRHEASMRHFQQASGVAASSSAQIKAEGCKEELEELTMKVEQARDTFAAELYALVSREPSVCQSLLLWYELQAAYHERALNILNQSTPKLCKLIEQSSCRPLYGCSLEDHLRSSGREIALVLEACICCLVETATYEEGLFRIAGSASKVKKLKNALDAGVTNMCEYVTDPHSVAGALKSYLRALPEPLMTFAAYDDWIMADKIPDSDSRLQRLWQVLNGLPKINYNNLRYLIKFLHYMCKTSEVTKMSSQNMSIVIAPNLLWSPASLQSTHIGMNMSAANAHSSIVETLITYCDWFFPDEVVFRITMPALYSPRNLLSPPLLEDGSSNPTMLRGIVNSGFDGANGEPEDMGISYSGSGQSPRVIHRPGKKPAPPVPPVFGNQTSEGNDYKLSQRSSPPFQLDRRPEFTISRSATLDRPGKPKRASTRKSHDNLASILADIPIPTSQPAVPKKEQASLPVASATQSSAKKEESSPPLPLSSQQTSKREINQPIAIESQSFAAKKEQFMQLASRPVDDMKPIVRKEEVSEQAGPVVSDSQLVARQNVERKEGQVTQPSATVPQPIPRKEREVAQLKTESSSCVPSLSSAPHSVLVNHSNIVTGDLTASQNTDPQKSPQLLAGKKDERDGGPCSVSEPVSEHLVPKEIHAGQFKGSSIQLAPTVKEKEVANQISIENHSQSSQVIMNQKVPSSLTAYENISSHAKKESVHVKISEIPLPKVPVYEATPKSELPTELPQPTDSKSEDNASIGGPTFYRTSESLEKETKPQIPCKPAALIAENKISQESSHGNSLHKEVPSADKTTTGNSTVVPSAGEHAESRSLNSNNGGSGDRWNFLTSGSGTEKAPDRPPKVTSQEGLDLGDGGKRPPPSPTPRVKPPRPQPPLPPVKPKMNNESEETRL